MNDACALQFKVKECSAEAVKEEYKIDNILIDDPQYSFCTLTKTNVNIELIYVGGKNCFTLREMEIRSPVGKSSPLKNGLIWISETPFKLQFKEYNDFTQEKYDQASFPEDNRPIYFEVPKDSLSTRIKLPSPLEGKYITIKLLSAWKGSVLNVEYFGFYGIDGTINKPIGPISISPLDIMSNIFHILDLNTFFNCALVSKRWNSWANSDAVWSRIFDKFGWGRGNSEDNFKTLYLKRSLRHINDWNIRGPGPGKVTRDLSAKSLLDISVTLAGPKIEISQLLKLWFGQSIASRPGKVSRQSLVYNRRRLHVSDVSSLPKENWTAYFTTAHVVVWVIDGTDRESIETKREFITYLTKSTTASCAFLVVKQEVLFAMDGRDFVQSYDIGVISKQWKTKRVYVESASLLQDHPQNLGAWKLLDWLSFNSTQKK
eukprot:TRINITY_DN21593_c0_g1_i1.p1 TRINITY_DN21593_c0_g1~~TRINITY_DN21593_c0_g1_i1.p1  ORF type:complete len:439 (-),score=87.65 TRINITY_DN21593_c0_g1_i1:44-1336(-)